jgi:hypothetical protein
MCTPSIPSPVVSRAANVGQKVDHLNGIVCCDRMESRTLTTFEDYSKHWAEHSVEEARAAVALDER